MDQRSKKSKRDQRVELCGPTTEEGHAGIKMMLKVPAFVCEGCNRVAPRAEQLCYPEEM